MSTQRQRYFLVQAVQAVSLNLDGGEYEPWISDEWLKTHEPFDDRRIGGECRQHAAEAIRIIRATDDGRELIRQEIARRRSAYSRNPGRYGMETNSRLRREYPRTITRKARRARRHRDCCYCGTGLSVHVCGVCREAGIDGPVIKGTEAVKATTYTKWERRRS